MQDPPTPAGTIKGTRSHSSSSSSTSDGHAPQQQEEGGLKEREALIRKLLQQNPVDLEALRQVALSPGGGFVSDELRMCVWPKLLGINRFAVGEWRYHVVRNESSEQIERDVDRSLWTYLLSQSKKRKRGNRRRVLADMINAAVVKNEGRLQYYQGYHDVLSVLVLTLTDDDKVCFAVAERVTQSLLPDYVMRSDFSVLTHLLELVFCLVQAFDAEVGQFLRASGVSALVALPAIITLFAHDCHDLAKVARLFDAILATAAQPLFPLYLVAAMILEGKNELLQLSSDFATVHTHLARLPCFHGLDVELLISRAQIMMRKKPPQKLIKTSRNAVLLDLVRRGELYALQPPAEWYSKEASPDWMLVDAHRRTQGRTVRCKRTRQRRRKAFLAGVQMENNNGKKPANKRGLWGTSPSILLAGVATAAMTAFFFRFGEASDIMQYIY